MSKTLKFDFERFHTGFFEDLIYLLLVNLHLWTIFGRLAFFLYDETFYGVMAALSFVAFGSYETLEKRSSFLACSAVGVW